MYIKMRNFVDKREWDSLLEKDGQSIFKTVDWSKFTSGNPRYLVAVDKNKLVGGMYFHESKVLFRKALVADASPIASDENVRLKILRKFKMLPGMKIINTTYQDEKISPSALTAGFKYTDKATVIVNLKYFDTTKKSLDKKRRYDINKAVEKGVEIVDATENEDDWKEFFNIYEASGKTWKIQILDRIQFMKLKMLSSGNLAKLFLAKLNGNIISGSIVLDSGNTAIFFINATNPNMRHVQTNSLLVWENLNYAKMAGFEYFDLFGYDLYAKENEKTYGINKFKLSFGGEVKRFYKFTDSNLFVVGRKIYNKIRLLKKIYFLIQRSI